MVRLGQSREWGCPQKRDSEDRLESGRASHLNTLRAQEERGRNVEEGSKGEPGMG